MSSESPKSKNLPAVDVEDVVLVQVVVVEGDRQAERGHLVGPTAYDGKVREQPPREVCVDAPLVEVGQRGVLLDPRPHIVDRLERPELGHPEVDQLGSVRGQLPWSRAASRARRTQLSRSPPAVS